MAAKHIPDTLDLHLCFKLYSTSLKMTQIYKPMLSALNLTYPQYLVLVILWEEEGLGIKDLAQRLGQDPGSITPLIDRSANSLRKPGSASAVAVLQAITTCLGRCGRR